MSDNIPQSAGSSNLGSRSPASGDEPSRGNGVGGMGRVQMSMEPEGWYMDAGPPSWDAKANTFSFFIRKLGHEPVMCILAMDALENAAQSSDLSEPARNRIFDAHRLMIELRAAQKLNAGLLDADGRVLLGVDDLKRQSGGAQPCPAI